MIINIRQSARVREHYDADRLTAWAPQLQTKVLLVLIVPLLHADNRNKKRQAQN